jgi:hypothetical protein
MKRLSSILVNAEPASNLELSELKKFISEYDKRKKLNFKKIFPQYTSYLESIPD